jgi:Tol biopolymer transport system component
MTMPDPVTNPYVGPRTFTRQESDRFFGREREARDLLSLVISKRLVLFYAQSGAGKSSLINTRLAPQLLQEGFVVLPIARVSGELPAGISAVANIFAFNLMLSLDQRGGDPGRFTSMTLADFLARLTTTDGERYYYDDTPVGAAATAPSTPSQPPHVLIIDQFEEILTTHLEHWQDRGDFLRQLGQALTDDPLLWVVLTLREDHVAALDPYADLLPGKMQARFYMQRMGYEAALEAVKKPAERYSRPFAAGVAESLVDNLRQIRVQGETTPQLGQFVEPVQLQVVCYQLWENLKNRPPGEITQQYLQELGDVDTALAGFYEQAIAKVLAETGGSEVTLRNWFEQNLITEAGTRGSVYRGAERSGGLSTRAADLLADQFLLRTENRTGGIWYELVHDRFIAPILKANQAWRLRQPLLQMAQAWADARMSDSKLLEGQPLKEALATNWKGLGPLVEEFVTASQAAQKAREDALEAEKEAQRQRELEAARKLAEEQKRRADVVRGALVGVAALLLLVLAAAVCAFVQQQQALRNAHLAATSGAQAQANANLAATRGAQAETNANLAATRAAEAVTARAVAELGRGEAESAQGTAEARRLEAVAAQGTAESRRTQVETAVAAAITGQNALATQAAGIQSQLATAQAPTATPTPSPTILPPTQAPSPQPGLPPTRTPTVTPPPTRTPGRDSAGATATIAALQAQLAQVKAAQVAVAEALPTPPGSIVFTRKRLNNEDLYSVKADGSGEARRLTFNSAQEPSYSPGANKIVFSRIDGQRVSLYTINPDGSGEANVDRHFGVNWQPAFSFDGRRVAFVSNRDGNEEIYSMRIDGSDVKRLTNDPADDQSPAWSPDGKRIAFASKRKGGPDIWIMNADGSNPIRLTASGATDTHPAWSPDGKQIAFSSTRDGNAEIYLADLSQGGTERNLTQSRLDEDYPSWSPDGKWLAFSRYTKNDEIFVMTVDGRYLTNLSNSDATDWCSTWVP